MKITKTQLRRLIREAMTRITPDEVAAWKNGDWSYVSGDDLGDDLHKMDASMAAGDDPDRFLHGEDPHDDEGSMIKSRLYSMKQMAKDVCDIINPQDQLPGWVQDHIAVAHENLQQVHGYLMGQQHAMESGMVESTHKKTLSEAYNRVTKEEMDAWMRGDWGFVSESSDTKYHDSNVEWVNAVYTDDRTVGDLLNAYDDMTKMVTGVSSSGYQDLLGFHEMKISKITDEKTKSRVEDLIADLASLAEDIDNQM